MGSTTHISWTGATWNSWQGCRKKSRACKFCYMFRDKRRYGQDPQNIHRSSKATFDAPLKWQREVERGDRVGHGRLVFTCSWSDWFIREADAWRDDAWAIIRACPDLIFQVLTKRSTRIYDHTPWVASGEAPWPNVWLGVSVENQALANERIPDLLRVPAHVRFLSCEPLLGPIDLNQVRWQLPDSIGVIYGSVLGDTDGSQLSPRGAKGWGIHQVIAGGESGSEAGVEPTHPDWVRAIRDQCVEAGVAFHFKQWGEHIPYDHASLSSIAACSDTGVFRDMPTYRVGKKRAGRMLDGRTWDEYPVALEAVRS